MILRERATPRAPARAAALLAAFASAGIAAAATPSGTTGQSWTDPPLGEVLRTADVVAEVRVFVGGQFSVCVDVLRAFKGAPSPTIRVEGINSYEWNTAYYSMREGETYILALYRAGAAYCPATPSSARFPLDNNRVIGRFGAGEFLVEIPVDEFRAALAAFFVPDPADAARAFARLIETGSVEARYAAVVLAGERAAGAGADAAAITGILEPVARDPTASLRTAAARALGAARSSDATRELARLVADADWSVSLAAAMAVCDSRTHGAGRELVAWLERAAARARQRRARDDPRLLRAQGRVLQFLAEGEWLDEAGDEERSAVVRGMIEIVASAEPVRARVAARVLGRMGAVGAVETLARVLDAEDTALREEAAAALVAITLSPSAYDRDEFAAWWRQHKGEPRRRWIADGLALAGTALSRRTYEGRSLARAILAIARDPGSVWAVREHLATGAGWSELPVDAIGGPLVAPFAELDVASRSAATRAAGVRALGAISRRFPAAGPAFVPALAGVACDTDADVRLAVAETLGGLDVARLSDAALARIADLLVAELVRGPDTTARVGAEAALRAIAGRQFGFYVSKGYELVEEQGGLERWQRWWAEASRAGVRRRAAIERAPPTASRDGRPVLARLGDADAAVWLAAVDELCAAGAPGRVAAAIASPDAKIRALGTVIAGLRADAAAGDAVVAALADSEPMVRLCAAWAAGSCLAGSQRPPGPLLQMARAGLAPAGGVDAKMPDAASSRDETLPPSIAGYDPAFAARRPSLGAIQAQAIVAAGKIGGGESVALLSELVASPDGDVSALAAHALALGPDDAARAAMVASLSTCDSTGAREALARGLAAFDPPGAVEALIAAAARLDRWSAYPLVNALGRIARASDASALAPYLDPENESAAVAAAYALAKEPGMAAAPGLMTMVESGPPTARYYAVKALGTLAAGRALPGEMGARASEALASRLAESDVTIASAAASALEHAGEITAGPVVMRYLESYDPPDVRAFGAAVRLGGSTGLAYVLGRMKAESWGAKYFALRALRHAPSTEVTSILVKYWRDPESPYQEVVAQSLIARGARSVPALAEILRSAPGAEARRAAFVLAGIEAPEALAAIERAAASVDRDTARAAELALALRAAGALRAAAPHGR